jgi:hypothetical protein
MVDPDGLPLETAIECAVGPLEPLFAAAKAAVAYRPRLLPGAWRPPDPEHMRIHHAFLAQLDATVAPFLRLLADGEWTGRVRPWDQIGGRLWRLRPDETAQLSIKVLRESLSLHGPGGERLYGLFRRAPRTTATPTPTTEPVIQSNKQWLGWAVKTVLPALPIKHGWKTAYAKKLARELNEAAKTNPTLKPLQWVSIFAALGRTGWPETDKPTTK